VPLDNENLELIVILFWRPLGMRADELGIPAK
jgi:hypothetical protein